MAKKSKSKIDLIENSKHKSFVLEYIRNGRNATKAYMNTYPKAKYNSSRANANKLLTKTDISEAIQEYLKNLFLDKEKQIHNIFDRLIDVSDSDISDYIDESGRIKVDEFKNLDTYPVAQYDKTISDTKEGQNVKQSIKMMDKLKAISELVKILQMITEKVEHSGTIEVVKAVRPDKIDEN